MFFVFFPHIYAFFFFLIYINFVLQQYNLVKAQSTLFLLINLSTPHFKIIY